MLSFRFVASVVVSLILAFYCKKYYENTQENVGLVIGILSSEDNFAYRKAARSTWLKNYLRNNSFVKPYFIIGKNSCNVPLDYRLSQYSCDKIPFNISGIQRDFSSSNKVDFKSESMQTSQKFHQGFSFKVNFPVVIKGLGVLFNLLAQNTEAKIAILEIQHKVLIVEAKVSRNKTQTSDGYLYQSVEEILLPKNFEGMVLVEGYLLDSARNKMTWNDGGGVVSYMRIYSSPSNTDTIPYSPDIFVASSIQFFVKDFTNLNTFINGEEVAATKWRSYVKNIRNRVDLEAAEYGDIVFVDVVDTYRNLPNKMLQFYKWVDSNHKYSYVLKTDDDTVIDIKSVLEKLQGDTKFDSSKKWMLSRFRREWGVNYIGKWADYDYTSPLYPTFPCGAAYVLPSKLVSWLSHNSDHLFPYQGEDVSMGIWLAALNPEYIEDINFGCNTKCYYSSYNVAQLESKQIYDVWAMYEKCNNLCACKKKSTVQPTFDNIVM